MAVNSRPDTWVVPAGERLAGAVQGPAGKAEDSCCC